MRAVRNSLWNREGAFKESLDARGWKTVEKDALLRGVLFRF